MIIKVCFWGMTRSLSFTQASIEKHILGPLKRHGIAYKVYANWNTTKMQTNPRAGEKGLQCVGDIHSLPVAKESSQDQNAIIDKEFPAAKYLRHGIPKQWTSHMVTFQNHIRSLASLQRVQQLAQSDPGDIFIFLRPDVKYLHDLPVNVLQQAQNDPRLLACPQFANELNHALNDRFAICGSQAASVYANRIHRAEIQSHQKTLHSEEFLKWISLQEHLSEIQFPNFFFQRIRCDGSIAAADKNFK